MRIVIVNKFARITGGADVHALDLARVLRRRGHAVRFLSTADPGNVELEGHFVPPSVTSTSRASLSPAQQLKVLGVSVWNPEAGRAMDDLIARFAPDVVHTHKLYPQLSVAPVVVAHRRRVPVVQTIQDYEFIAANPLDDRGRMLDRDEERLTYRVLNTVGFAVRRHMHVPRVARWITVSEAVAALHRPRGIRPVVLRNFALGALHAAEPVGAREGVVFLGRLTREKGADLIVELARRLPATPVTVAGMGREAPAIEYAARRLPNLVFAGRVEAAEVPRFLATAQISVMPSRWADPGPHVAIESMAVGTPIVAFDNGGLGEYVRESGAGVAVRPTADALVAGCRALLEDDARWRQASDAGRTAITTMFSPDDYAERIEAVYREAIVAAGGTPR